MLVLPEGNFGRQVSPTYIEVASMVHGTSASKRNTMN
jgi:hypothetical protein